jgi:hypothetical protein
MSSLRFRFCSCLASAYGVGLVVVSISPTRLSLLHGVFDWMKSRERFCKRR